MCTFLTASKIAKLLAGKPDLYPSPTAMKVNLLKASQSFFLCSIFSSFLSNLLSLRIREEKNNNNARKSARSNFYGFDFDK